MVHACRYGVRRRSRSRSRTRAGHEREYRRSGYRSRSPWRERGYGAREDRYGAARGDGYGGAREDRGRYERGRYERDESRLSERELRDRCFLLPAPNACRSLFSVMWTSLACMSRHDKGCALRACRVLHDEDAAHGRMQASSSSLCVLVTPASLQ